MMRRGVALLTAALLATVTVGAGVGPAVASTGDDTSGSTPIVFILDASGSMVRETSTGQTRMEVAKAATIETLSSLPEGAAVGALVFGTGTGNSEAERAAGCDDVSTLAPLGALDLPSLSSAIESVTASGFTPIGPALRQAVAMLPSGEPGTIVLVSDGVDTCSPPSSCEIASQLHAENPLVTINVVGFGVDDDEEASQQMTCIGGVGGGTAVNASDPTQLVSQLRAATRTTSTGQLGVLGFNGVQLGMTVDEVRARVDGAEVSDPEVVDGVEIIYIDCGWGTVEVRDNRVFSISPDDIERETAEGITVGAALSTVEAIYGTPVEIDERADDPSAVFAVRPGTSAGYRVFYDRTNTITRVVLCRCVPVSAYATALSDWEITFDGIGPLELGMTRAEASAVAPDLINDPANERSVIRGSDGSNAVIAHFLDDRIARLAVGERWAMQTPSGAGLPHANGIRLGDSAATAQFAVPGGSIYYVVVAGINDYIVANREGRVLTFGLTNTGGIETVKMIAIADATATLAPDAPYLWD